MVLAAVAMVVGVAGAYPHPPALPADTILDRVIDTARHGDLRDVAFIERTFHIALEPRAWRDADTMVLGYRYPPATLPFTTGRAFLSLIVRTTLSVLRPSGEYEIGELSIWGIDTVRCISRHETERRLTDAFGQKAPAFVSPDNDHIESLFGDGDQNRSVYVNAIFNRKADCLAAIDILHRH